jgi:serine/threonine protein kinase/formylglycine-generating enzyme required for sulfatase activity
MPPGDPRYAGDATSELTPPAAGEVRPGTQLGQYRLLERIGAGGMGQVFKAVHPTMQRVVAVKIMGANLVQDARARARFRREVQSAARLAHPNIVMAYDAAEEAGRCFLVMEYVEGRDAAALVQAHGPAPVGVACDIVRQAALGLQHAHEQGMVHRDIKPGNLVIAARRPPGLGSGSGPVPAGAGWPALPLVKVLDFGLARIHAGDSDPAIHVPGSTPLTREGYVVGTPEFMAPEQASGFGHTDIRSDIYSLGCTFYCLLTGRPPFSGSSLLEIMVQHLHSPLPPVTDNRPDVAPDVAAVLERMLAKRPEDRYQTPGEVADALLPLITYNRPTEAVVRSGQPVNLFPETRTAAAAANPTLSAAVAAPPTPRPGLAQRAAAATGRGVFGGVGLFLILVASGVLGFLYLLRTDGGPPADTAPDGPRAGPVAGMRLVSVPAGRYAPSFGPRGSAVEVPRDFEMSMTEVTREQFRAFAHAAVYQTDAEKGAGAGRGALVRTPHNGEKWSEGAAWDSWRPDLPDNTPVVCVSWQDAVQFCNWLSEREKLPPCYRLEGGPRGGWECNFAAPGYRLPTEAEWELAARAGDGALYPEPETALLEHGWFAKNSDSRPQPVGGRPGNRRELRDVWGNAWEWCWDRQTAGPPRLPLSPTGPDTGDKRVVRGGGWCDPVPVNAAQTRRAWPTDFRANDVGFRVARTLPPR